MKPEEILLNIILNTVGVERTEAEFKRAFDSLVNNSKSASDKASESYKEITKQASISYKELQSMSDAERAAFFSNVNFKKDAQLKANMEMLTGQKSHNSASVSEDEKAFKYIQSLKIRHFAENQAEEERNFKYLQGLKINYSKEEAAKAEKDFQYLQGLKIRHFAEQQRAEEKAFRDSERLAEKATRDAATKAERDFQYLQGLKIRYSKDVQAQEERDFKYLQNLRLNSAKQAEQDASNAVRRELQAMKLAEAEVAREMGGGGLNVFQRTALARVVPGGYPAAAGISEASRLAADTKQAQAALRAIDPDFQTFLRHYRSLPTDIEKATLAEARFGGNVEKLLPQLNAAASEFSHLEKQAGVTSTALDRMGISGGGLAAIIGGALVLALAAAGFAIFEIVKATAETENKMYALSQKTGTAVETLSALDIAAQKNHSSVDKLSQQLAIFSKNLDKANFGTDVTSRTMRRLGLDLHDSSHALEQTFSILSHIGNDADRVGLAMQLFGRGGAEMLKVVRESNGDLAAYKKHLQDIGVLMTGKEAFEGHQFTEQLTEVQQQLSTIGRSIVTELGPMILQTMRDLVGFLRDHKQDVVDSISVIGKAVDWFLIKPTEGWIALLGLAAQAMRFVGNAVTQGPTAAANIEFTRPAVEQMKAAAGSLINTRSTGNEDFEINNQKSELERLTDQYNKTTQAIKDLQNVGSKEFEMKFKLEDATKFKSDLERILTLRHELGMPLKVKPPVNDEEAMKALENLEDLKKQVTEIKKLTDAQDDANRKMITSMIGAQVAVVDAQTRAQTRYFDNIRARKDAEAQLTADLAIEIEKRDSAQRNSERDFRQVQAQGTLDQLKQIDAARTAAMKATVDARMALITNPNQFNNGNPSVAAALSIANKLADPRSPTVERLDTTNDILRKIETNTKAQSAADLIQKTAEAVVASFNQVTISVNLDSNQAGGNLSATLPGPARQNVVSTPIQPTAAQDYRDAAAFRGLNLPQGDQELVDKDKNPFGLDSGTLKDQIFLTGHIIKNVYELAAATDIADQRTKRYKEDSKEEFSIIIEGLKRNIDFEAEHLTLMNERAAKRKVEVTDQIQSIYLQEKLNRLKDPSTVEHRAVQSDESLRLLNQRIDLTEEAIRLQYDLEHANEDQAERGSVVQLRALRDIQKADEDATDAMIADRVRLADATIYHANRADAKVMDYLASQTSVTDAVGNLKVGIIQNTFDYIDRGLDMANSKLGLLGQTLASFESALIRLWVIPAFQKLFGLGGNAQTQGSGNIFSYITGGIGGGSGIGPGGTPVFNFGGGAGQSQMAGASPFSILSHGFQLAGQNGSPATLTSILASGAGSNVGFGPTLTGGLSQNSQIATILHEGVHSGVGGAGAATLGSSSLTASLAMALPALGLSAGASLGGMFFKDSRAASTIGSLAGGALGLSAGLAAYFGLGGGVGAGALGTAAGVIAGALPFIAPIAIAALIAAWAINRSALRRKEETERTDILRASKQKMEDLIAQARKGGLSVEEGKAAYTMIRADYLTQVGQLKDSKTRRIAEETVREIDAQWNQVLLPLLQKSDRAKELETAIVPTFASGGQMRYDGLAYVHSREVVLNEYQQRRVGVDRIREAVNDYQPPTSANSRGTSNTAQPVHVTALLIANEEAADAIISRGDPNTVYQKMEIAVAKDGGRFLNRLAKSAR